MRYSFAFRRAGLALGTSLSFALAACAVAREDPALRAPSVGEAAQANDGGTSAASAGGTSGSGGSSGTTANGGSGGGAGGAAGKSVTGGSAGSSAGSGGSSGTTSSGGSSGSNSGGQGGSASGSSGTSGSTSGGSAGSASGAGGGAGTNTAGTNSAGTSSAGTGGTTMSGEVLFSDDFETSDAADWFPSADDAWAVVMDDSNVYEQGPPLVNMERFSSAGDGEWTDVSVEARVKITAFNGQSSSYFAAVYARVESASSYYAFALRSDGKVSIRSGNSNLGSAEDAGIVEGEYFDVKFVARGSTLTGFINGAQVTQITDPSITNGAIGVGTRNTSAMFDDVLVTVP